jgi:hypothetical protein
MPPAGLNIVKRSGKYIWPLKKTQPSCPGSRDLNWTGKGLNIYSTNIRTEYFKDAA